MRVHPSLPQSPIHSIATAAPQPKSESQSYYKRFKSAFASWIWRRKTPIIPMAPSPTSIELTRVSASNLQRPWRPASPLSTFNPYSLSDVDWSTLRGMHKLTGGLTSGAYLLETIPAPVVLKIFRTSPNAVAATQLAALAGIPTPNAIIIRAGEPNWVSLTKAINKLSQTGQESATAILKQMETCQVCSLQQYVPGVTLKQLTFGQIEPTDFKQALFEIGYIAAFDLLTSQGDRFLDHNPCDVVSPDDLPEDFNNLMVYQDGCQVWHAAAIDLSVNITQDSLSTQAINTNDRSVKLSPKEIIKQVVLGDNSPFVQQNLVDMLRNRILVPDKYCCILIAGMKKALKNISDNWNDANLQHIIQQAGPPNNHWLLQMKDAAAFVRSMHANLMPPISSDACEQINLPPSPTTNP